MRFLFSAEPRFDRPLPSPFLVPGRDGYIYRNGAEIYPHWTEPEPSQEAVATITRAVGQLIDEAKAAGDRPIVVLDHPRFDHIYRHSETAHRIFEELCFAPMRKHLGDEALIVQYGVHPDDLSYAMSVDPSITLYDPERIDDFAMLEWPDDPRAEDCKTVWIPAVGQYTNAVRNRAYWWTAQEFAHAVSACNHRGIENVIVWFNPGKHEGTNVWAYTEAMHRQTMRVLCYWAGWGVIPMPQPELSENDFTRLLTAISAQPFLMSEVLSVLTDWEQD